MQAIKRMNTSDSLKVNNGALDPFRETRTEAGGKLILYSYFFPKTTNIFPVVIFSFESKLIC